LPDYFGRRRNRWFHIPRPDGQPYLEKQSRGDVLAYAGSELRMRAEFTKPVRTATLELLRLGPNEESHVVLREFPVELNPAADSANFAFDLRPGEDGYRLRLVDERGFASLRMTPGRLNVKADLPPYVALLHEVKRPDLSYALNDRLALRFGTTL